MFGFALDTGNNPEIITSIEAVKNLEGSFTYRKLRLINVENVSSLKSVIEKASKTFETNGFIYLLDKQESIVAGTFISNIKIIKSKQNDIILTGFVWQHPKGYQKAWNMNFNNEITQRNLWKKFRKDELQGWLVYALHSRNVEITKKDVKIQIDGNEFHNLDSFFCALGEQINGPGGYFGRNLIAMEDCLRGDFGVESISELTWINHQRSKKLFKTKFNSIIEIFKKFNTRILLE